MSERDELMADLARLSANGRTSEVRAIACAACNLLERDGARIAELEAENARIISGIYYQEMRVERDEARKALAEAREALARWLIAHSFATGHGDTLDDLLSELTWQVNTLAELAVENKALRKESARMDYVRKAFLLDGNDAIFEFCLAESTAEFNDAIDAVLATRVPDAAIAKEQKP